MGNHLRKNIKLTMKLFVAKDGTIKYEIFNKIENTRLFFKRIVYQVQSHCNTDL